MENQDPALSTHAGLVRVLDNPDSTPEDVRRAVGWGVIPGLSARIWLVGYLAGRRAAPAPPPRPTDLAVALVEPEGDA